MSSNTPQATVSGEALADFVTAIFIRLGAGQADAARTADVIVEADLRGVDSHGVRGLSARIGDLQAGRTDIRKTPTLAAEFGAMARFDGHHGYGPLLCSTVTDKATDLAASHGLGMALLVNSSHWGCPAYYARQMAAKGYIGIAMTNTNSAMPLWGSSAKSVGNNPLVIAAPRRNHEPVVLDMTMQQISWGGIGLAREEGTKLPAKWGYDKDGQETDDPAAIMASGRVRPVGDHKGSGLAFMIEILTGALAAGAVCYELDQKTREGQPAHYAQTFLAIKPDVFAGQGLFFDKIDVLFQGAKAAPLASGVERILLPGDRSNETMAIRRRDGIPTGRIRRAVEHLSAEFDIPSPLINPLTAA